MAGRITWPYLAGFFDGEGHIAISRQMKSGDGHYTRGTARISIVQAGERGHVMLRDVQLFLKQHGIPSTIKVHNRTSRLPHHQISYDINVSGFKSVVAMAKNMMPYLIIKKSEAQDLIRFQIIYPSLVGRGHSHSDNVKKAWETRRERYINGYRRTSTPSEHGKVGADKRWEANAQ